jgi:hypothetical protein
VTQEVSCKIIRNVLDFARQHGGERAVSRIVDVAGVPYETLRDENAWIDHDAEKRIFRALDDILHVDRPAYQCGEHGVLAGSMGALDVLVRSLLRPHNAYARLPYIANRLAKVGKLEVVAIGPNRAHVRYRYREPFESIREICENRRGMLAAVPRLWGLPRATIEERECSADGGEVCDYHIDWVEPLEDRMRLRCAAAGALSGATLMVLTAENVLRIGWIAAGAAAGLAVIGGWLIGDAWDSGREMQAVRALVAQQNEKLAQQLVALEHKFRELDQHREVLESQVADRTVELERGLARLKRLNELSRVITATLDAPAIVELALGSLGDLFDARGHLLAPAKSAFDEDGSGASPVPTEATLTDRERRAAHDLADKLCAEGLEHLGARIGDDHSLTVLLSSSEDPLGTLTVVRDEEHGEFGPRDVEVARLLADIFASALVNAHLIERAQRVGLDLAPK